MSINQTLLKRIDEIHDKLTWEEEQIRQQQNPKWQASFDRLHGDYLAALRENDPFLLLAKESLDEFLEKIPKDQRKPFLREMNIREDMDALVATKEKLATSTDKADEAKAQEQLEKLYNAYIFRAPLAPRRPKQETAKHMKVASRVQQEISERKKIPKAQEKENTPPTLSAEEAQFIAQQKANLGLAIARAPNDRIHDKFDASDITQPIQAGAPGAVKLGERTGHILTLAAQNYVRKLQLEGKAPPNTFLDNTVPPHLGKLNFPVFIGQQGEPIALYNKATKALGKGAFGEVYLGINIDNGKVYAVKKQESGEDVLKEEEILKDINVFVDKVGISGTQFEYGAQALAWGKDIEKYLADNSIGYEQKAHVFKLALEKLDELHQKGYVHRDIKMANLIYDPVEDKIVVVDVGLAAELQNGRFRDNKSVGTKSFMPKEIIDPVTNPVEYSAATDLYSAGVMGAYMLHTPSDSVMIDELMLLLEKQASGSLQEFKANYSNIRNFMENQFPSLKTQEAIQAWVNAPNTAEKMKSVWPSGDLVLLGKAMSQVFQLSAYDLAFNDLQRKYMVASDKNDFIKNLPTQVRSTMPDIFQNPSDDPLKQAVNNMLQLMCTDRIAYRPDFKTAISFFDEVDRQFALRRQGKLDPKALTTDFQEQCRKLFSNLAKSNPSQTIVHAQESVAPKTAAQPAAFGYSDVQLSPQLPPQFGYSSPSLDASVGVPVVDPKQILKIEQLLEDFKTNMQANNKKNDKQPVAFSFWGERDASRTRQHALVDKILKVVNPLVDKKSMTLNDLLQIQQVIVEVRFESLANKQGDIQAQHWNQNEGPLGEVLQKIDQHLNQELEKFPAVQRGMEEKEVSMSFLLHQ